MYVQHRTILNSGIVFQYIILKFINVNSVHINQNSALGTFFFKLYGIYMQLNWNYAILPPLNVHLRFFQKIIATIFISLATYFIVLI